MAGAGDPTEGASGLPVDALVITVILVANGVIGYLQEKTDRAEKARLDRDLRPWCHVGRPGHAEGMTYTSLGRAPRRRRTSLLVIGKVPGAGHDAIAVAGP